MPQFHFCRIDELEVVIGHASHSLGLWHGDRSCLCTTRRASLQTCWLAIDSEDAAHENGDKPQAAPFRFSSIEQSQPSSTRVVYVASAGVLSQTASRFLANLITLGPPRIESLHGRTQPLSQSSSSKSLQTQNIWNLNHHM